MTQQVSVCGYSNCASYWLWLPCRTRVSNAGTLLAKFHCIVGQRNRTKDSNPYIQIYNPAYGDTDTLEKCFAHYRFQNIQTRSWKPTWPALVIPYGSRTAGLWVAFKCGPLNKSNLPLWAWAMAGFDHSWPSELVLNRTSFWWSMWPAEINSGLVAMIIVMLVVSGGDGGDVAVWSYLVLLMGHKNITETSDQVVCGYGACYIRTLKKSALETKLLWSLLPYFPMSQTTRVFRRCLDMSL